MKENGFPAALQNTEQVSQVIRNPELRTALQDARRDEVAKAISSGDPKALQTAQDTVQGDAAKYRDHMAAMNSQLKSLS